MRLTNLAVPVIALLCSLPLAAQQDLKASILKHLKTSRDFSVKVAEAMPDSDYDFKLTPPQMSFGGQMTHLAQGLSYFLSPFSGEKPQPAKPKSKAKADVVSFVQQSYDDAVSKVEALSPAQLDKTYKSEEGSSTGVDLLLGMLDHCTHHRASAEMYLRAKGIKPPDYQF